jgi:leucyl aminopeptidase (aminopeptidase T)
MVNTVNLDKGARIAVRTCMNVAPGESVLVVTDPARLKIAKALVKAVGEAKAEATLMLMKTTSKHGEEPPEIVACAMRGADVVLAPTTFSITHTQARMYATLAGARIATMPMITEEMMCRGAMLADYNWVRRLTLKVSNLLDKAREVEILTEAGTRLKFSVRGRKTHPDTGIFHMPGDFGNLPAGEAFIAPVEGSGRGEAVIDGSMVDKLTGKIHIRFEKGEATEVHGSKSLVKMLRGVGPKARNLAEFGIGTNPKAMLIGNVLEDEKVLGTCHIALGDNSTFGGKVKAGFHVDGIILKPTVKFDGKILMDEGKLKF